MVFSSSFSLTLSPKEWKNRMRPMEIKKMRNEQIKKITMRFKNDMEIMKNINGRNTCMHSCLHYINITFGLSDCSHSKLIVSHYFE